MKLQYIRIDGKVEVNKRYKNVKSFQEDENVKVAILSLTAAGTGLNLTAASTVIFAEVIQGVINGVLGYNQGYKLVLLLAQ